MSEMRAQNLPMVSANGEMTRVLLLGVLRDEPMHGYAVKQKLSEWHMDFWADVKVGSIYAGLKRLVTEGLLKEVGESRKGNRPVRMTYEITDAGRHELSRLLRAFWTPPGRMARPVDLALQLVNALPVDEIEPLLRERLQALENQAAIFEPPFVPQFDDAATQSRVEDLFDHERRLLAAEREWCEHVLARVRTGAYTPKRRRK